MTALNEGRITELRQKFTQLEGEVMLFLESSVGAPLQDEEVTALTYGLELISYTDLFTEEESLLIEKVEDLLREAFDIFNDIQSEQVSLLKAQREAEHYETRIGEPLDVIQERNNQEREEITGIINAAHQLSSVAKANGWHRYEEALCQDADRTVNEAKAIINALTLVDFMQDSDFPYIVAPFPQALRINKEFNYYIAVKVLPIEATFSESDREKQIASMEQILTPMLYHHRKALAGDKDRLVYLDGCIEKKRKGLADELVTEVESFNSYITSSIETFSFPHDKISNNLTQLVKGEKTGVSVANRHDRKKGNQLITEVTLDFDNIEKSPEIKGNWDAIDPYDREIINAVFSVWIEACKKNEVHDGEAVTTLQTIYRVMTKDSTGTLRLPKDKEEELSNRLMKLNSAKLYINAEAEVKYYKALGEEETRAVLERRGQLMSIVIDKAKINGTLVDNAVHIIRLDLSPLYLYAKTKGQIESIPLKMLDAKSSSKKAKTIVKTTDTITIEGYLIRRITAMDRISDTIVIDKLLNEAGIYKENYSNFNKKRSETVKKIENILNGYVQTGYIKSFDFRSKGRIRYYSVVLKK